MFNLPEPKHQRYLNLYIKLVLHLQQNFSLREEKHHILPQSMGGKNEKHNIIYISSKAHFILHLLLWKAYRNREMSYALHCMRGKSKSNGRYFKLTSRQYSNLKSDFKKTAIRGKDHWNYGRKHTEEAKQNMSKAQKGSKRRKHTLEERKKMSENSVWRGVTGENHPNFGNPSGWKPSDEQRKKLSESHKGKTISEEAKQNMSKAQKGRKVSNEVRQKISDARKGVVNRKVKWVITFPNGQTKEIINLKTFCKENSLSYNSMKEVNVGKREIHRGFKCVKI